MYKVIAKLIGNTERTIFAWKKENRPIINFFEKYFSEEDLEEFLTTGKIEKLEHDKKNTNKVDELNNLLIELAKYQLRDRIRLTTEGGPLDFIGFRGWKNVFLQVLKDINKQTEEYPIHLSKKFLLGKIEDTKVSFIRKGHKEHLIKFVEKGFSNLDAYVAIKYYDEVFDYHDIFGRESEFEKDKQN